MRQAHIFYKDQLAGILTENDAGYEFCYLPEYLSLEKAKAVSMTLPLQEEALKREYIVGDGRKQ